LKFHNLQRDCGRPPVPRKDLEDKPEEEPLLSNHPYVEKVSYKYITFSSCKEEHLWWAF